MPKPLCALGRYFHPATNTVYFTDRCECCKGVVQQPNAVGLMNPEDFDLIHVDTLPPEINVYDEPEGVKYGCEDCEGMTELERETLKELLE